MAVSSGFFTSVNGDRKYSAEELCALFDGFITDGVMQTVGQRFGISVLSGRTIQVNTGRAWFNNTWVYNDAIITLDVPDAHVLLNRWDAVVLEINKDLSTRRNTIKMVQGVAANDPVKPSLTHTALVNQYAIAYIYSPAGSSTMNITNVVGTDETPYAGFLNQEQWLDDERAIFEAFMTDLHNTISADQIAQYAVRVEQVSRQVNTLSNNVSSLSGDVTNLATRVGTTENQISSLNTTVSAHTNSISTLNNKMNNLSAGDVAAGTFKGQVAAKQSAEANLGNAQCRNVTISDADLTDGTSPLASGEIYIYYA